MSFQTLILDNIELIGYKHQNNFFGEKSFNYSATKTLSIRGFVLDLVNTVGVKDIFLDTNKIKNISQNFQNVIINGQNFGIGKFISLSFDEGNWVRSTRFNADIEIYEDVPIQNLVSKEFTASNYIVTNTSSANPDILGYKFYKTSQISNGKPLYLDTTNQYILFYSTIFNRWIIMQKIGSINDRYQSSSSTSLTPPIGTYTSPGGVGFFQGSITLSYDSLNPTDIDLSNKRLDLIKSFSETFDLNFDQNSKILGGNHSIDIEYNADNKDINVIALAQSLASELLNKAIPANLSEYNYATRQEGTYKVLNNESYDVINGRCGFNKSFSYATNNNFKPYSLNRNFSINIETNGITTVEENCNIKAENDIPSLYENSLIGLNEQITGSYLRCSGFFESYKNKLNISGLLNNNLLEKTININKYNGTIDYTVNFDNDKKNSKNYIFEYTSVIDRNENFIWNISEKGSIGGIGTLNNNNKYLVAENGWLIEKQNISGRCFNLWNNQVKEKSSNNLNLLSKDISRSPYQGQISYDYVFTDDPSIRNDLGDIKKLEIEYTDDSYSGTNLLSIYKEFIIPRNNYVLIHKKTPVLKKQGTFSITAKADIAFTGVQQNTIFNGLNYFTTITRQVRSAYVGGYKDKYLESASFSSDEINQTITYEEVYKYS